MTHSEVTADVLLIFPNVSYFQAEMIALDWEDERTQRLTNRA